MRALRIGQREFLRICHIHFDDAAGDQRPHRGADRPGQAGLRRQRACAVRESAGQPRKQEATLGWLL